MKRSHGGGRSRNSIHDSRTGIQALRFGPEPLIQECVLGILASLSAVSTHAQRLWDASMAMGDAVSLLAGELQRTPASALPGTESFSLRGRCLVHVACILVGARPVHFGVPLLSAVLKTHSWAVHDMILMTPF